MAGGQGVKRRSRSAIESDHEADNVRFEGQRSSPESSDGAKRVRLRGGRATESEMDEEEDEDVGGEEEEDEDDEGEDQFHSFVDDRKQEPQTNGTSAMDFQPGAIVRVMVENFVTYEHAEFFPGPNLNMVIGPNGTGKSSLVCAICLGLGYHANVLGRASSFGEFVKHGKDSATVEVELQKRPNDRSNFIVRLVVKREDNTRKFWMNGRECTHKTIHSLMRELRIQIDNLCQFLPQDKVAEFAGLNSVDLLTKTLQAAAPEKMMRWQNDLKVMYAAQKESLQQSEKDAEQLAHLEMRQQGLQGDVDRLREREEIQKTVQDLEDARVAVQYNDARKSFAAAKERKKNAQLKLRDLERESGPSLEAVNRKQEYQAQVHTVVDERKNAVKEAERAADKLLSDVDNLDTKLTELDNKRDAIVNALKTKRQEVQTSRKKITHLEASLKKDHQEFNPADWNRKIREQEHLLRETESELRENQTVQQQGIKDQGRAKMEELKHIEADIRNLESQQGQKLSQLRKISPDCARGWEWLQENTAQFEKEVFGPPMLTCSVKDERYSNHIQSMLQNDDFLCFTAQTREDHKKLSGQFYGAMGLSVTIRTCTTDFGAFRPPLPSAELSALGLSGYALDYLDGPEPVLAMLCAEKKIHMSAVSLKDISDAQYERIVAGEVINSWAAGSTSYRVTRRREYGPGATSTRTSEIKPGRFWADQPVDMAEKTELERRKIEASGEVAELKQALADLREKHEALGATQLEIRQKLDDLKKAKNELQKEHNQWLAIPDKIEMEKKNLENKLGEIREERQRVRDMENKCDEVALEKARVALRHREQLDIIKAAHRDLLEAQVLLIEAKSDVAGLKERNADIVKKLEEEGRAVEQLGRELEECKLKARELLGKIEQLTDDAQRKEELSSIAQNKTVEEMDEYIAAEKAKLELIHAADPGVLREFENRAQQIDRLRKQKAEKEQELEGIADKIRRIRERWEPMLDGLVSKINDAFSYNFEQINCAGEVGVHKDEDFDKWAIEIKVKFRENETLQKLDQHRQSGGERAVSTIFYLMSLQSMAQAPFRVVDEINQGMDPRNERMVHERMVEIACREHTSQYFLITPKLLSGLRYDERMKVLCIASGQHMPREGSKLDFARCVKIRRRLTAVAGA
ncbi:putative structural maintenance of chromosome complex subunit protein [Phaeoacremonium minimum UCRPA7]|uniref:Structural maintenance of chromosomes protein 5 n=1 Tax=Phaeoacremonium minimum (strain UCR-PA7) TaxID=1286976 RepID=R8BID4_PHAM7|nr:putative structural maintenance of chromosome complex subunit protein [Phaeoacremonium minimum UCRPA7]EON99085.1 putative structural maintenance of chromosome complex subunit protein [Phaeoacremonium minimum UCRPA7]